MDQKLIKELEAQQKQLEALMKQTNIQLKEAKPKVTASEMWDRTKKETVDATKATGRFFQATWRLTKAGCAAFAQEMEAIKAEQK